MVHSLSMESTVFFIITQPEISNNKRSKKYFLDIDIIFEKNYNILVKMQGVIK